MTIREHLEKSCFERGMFPEQAKAVVDALAADEVSEPMEGRWDDPVEAYPPGMLRILEMGVDSAAVEWIDANCPGAWFRTLFTRDERKANA